MELTSSSLVSGHLLLLKLLSITHIAGPVLVKAHCFKSDVQIPALENSKHIEISIDLEKEVATLKESIRQLDTEIILDPPQTPLFLALLCLAGKDLSVTY